MGLFPVVCNYFKPTMLLRVARPGTYAGATPSPVMEDGLQRWWTGGGQQQACKRHVKDPSTWLVCPPESTDSSPSPPSFPSSPTPHDRPPRGTPDGGGDSWQQAQVRSRMCVRVCAEGPVLFVRALDKTGVGAGLRLHGPVQLTPPARSPHPFTHHILCNSPPLRKTPTPTAPSSPAPRWALSPPPRSARKRSPRALCRSSARPSRMRKEGGKKDGGVFLNCD